jgi:sugar phosphate isomerase/epimerase
MRIPALIFTFTILVGTAFFWCAAEPASKPEKSDAPAAAPCCPAEKTADAKEKPEPADNSYCYACHLNYEEEKLTRIHQPVGVGCENCHGPSIEHSGDEDNITPPDKMYPKSEINAFCMTCHEKEKLLKREDHRDFFKEGDKDETCTDCHGENHRLKVRTRVWDKKTRKLMKDDGVRMMEERASDDVLAPKNLVAWCIVPFDAKKRGPEERAQMLERLGITRLAYDWRDEHIPTFDEEVEAMKRHGVTIDAWWFPAGLNDTSRKILDVIGRHGIHPQLWITMGDPAPEKGQAEKVAAAAAVVRPIAEEAAKLGCKVALYNHGGWFGEPENQIAIIESLGLSNVGIVYNFHHGHPHIDRFPELFRKMQPHLLAVNLNGMVKDGEQSGKKILPIGQGDQEAAMLKAILASGWQGPVGILNHRTEMDAEEALRGNLDGLARLRKELAP